MSDSESVRDEAESARDEDLVSTLEEQESRLANAHRIAREAIDLCEQFVTRLTEMASTQKARDKAFGPSDGHIGRSEGVGALSGGEEEESSDAELSQGSDWEEAVLRIRAPHTAAFNSSPDRFDTDNKPDFEPGSSRVESAAQTDLCFGTPGSPVQCPVCLDDVRIVPPSGGRSDRDAVIEVATMRCGHHIHLSCLLPCFLAVPGCSSRPPGAFRCPVCRIPVSETLGPLLRLYSSASGGTRIHSAGTGRSGSVTGAFRRFAAGESLPASEQGGRSPGSYPRAPSMRGTGTGVRRGNGTGSGNGRTIGASLSTETTQSVAEGRAAGLGRGQRNSGNGLEDGRLRSISGSQLTEFQGPVQNPVGLGGSLLDADLGSFSGSGSGSGSGSDSDRETEGPRHRATALQEETERLEAVQLEREAQPEVRLPRGSRQHEPRVSTSSTILEAISASRERMENRAYVRQHLARDPNQEATRGIERAPAADEVTIMLRARHAAVLSTDPASLQQRQALLAANQPPVTSSGHEDANPIPNPDAHASDRFVPPAFSNSPVIGNLLSRRELSVTLNRSTARQMRAADDSGLDLNQGDANRGVLSSGAVRQSFPRRIVETSGNGTRYRLSQASERNPVPSDEEPGLDPGFRRGLSLDAPGLGEASEDLTYPPSRLGFRGLWGRAHQWQQNVHRRSIGDGSQSARQHTETETGVPSPNRSTTQPSQSQTGGRASGTSLPGRPRRRLWSWIITRDPGNQAWIEELRTEAGGCANEEATRGSGARRAWRA